MITLLRIVGEVLLQVRLKKRTHNILISLVWLNWKDPNPCQEEAVGKAVKDPQCASTNIAAFLSFCQSLWISLVRAAHVDVE